MTPCSVLHWLFGAECSTAAPLLSLSFAVNSIFMGLSFTRFNLSAGIRKKIVKYIDGIGNDKFLEKQERIRKEDQDILRALKKFGELVERQTEALKSPSRTWEMVRRFTAVFCAAIAFVWMAFEPKTRIGLVLVLPYLAMLLLHAIWVLLRYAKVKFQYEKLRKALDKAVQNDTDDFDIAACMGKLKKCSESLASNGNETTGNGR